MIHDKWKAVAQMPNGYAIEDSKGRVIAMTQCDEYENDDNPITQKEEIANANLIAASKDLLKALEELMLIVKIHSKGTDNNFAWAEMDFAQQAINKAKGE